MTFDRRSLLQGAGAFFTGFAIPDTPLPKTGRSVMWIVALAGSSRSPAGMEEFEAARQQARDEGFEVLDSSHDVMMGSRFLARKEVSQAYADEQERVLLTEKSDLTGIGGGILSLWIERGEL